ncbi:intracellular serine protease Isp [Bacillus wiedmannii]|nr:intracellular serine protease Isp [Bacillus wiedmannii]
MFDGKGKSSNEWITAGIINAINWRGSKGEKVRIISMSLSGKKDAYCLHEAIKLAVNNNILVVCAAGNDGDCREKTNELRYPGAYQEVVEVGSVDINKKIACKSNSNNHLDLVAPGEEIWSTDKDGGYAKLSGTSMATPHVSRAAALIIKQSEKEFKRILSESEIYAQLIKRTTNIGYSSFLVGNGIIDLSREC